MSKTKTRFVVLDIAENAVRVEHPEGGAFHILPFDFDEVENWIDSIRVEKFVRDDGGKILRNERSGDPSVRIELPNDKQIAYALTRLTRIDLQPTAEASPNFVSLAIKGCGAVAAFVREDEDGETWYAVDRDENQITSLNVNGRDVEPKKVVLAILKMMGADTFEVDVPLDTTGKEFTGAEGQVKSEKTTKVKRESKDNIFLWIPKKCAVIGAEMARVVEEN
jgi:hypothetical protein